MCATREIQSRMLIRFSETKRNSPSPENTVVDRVFEGQRSRRPRPLPHRYRPANRRSSPRPRPRIEVFSRRGTDACRETDERDNQRLALHGGEDLLRVVQAPGARH